MPLGTNGKEYSRKMACEPIPVLDILYLAAQGLNLKIDPEERKLSLSVYRRAMKAKTQNNTAIMDNGIFPLGAFIVPMLMEILWKMRSLTKK